MRVEIVLKLTKKAYVGVEQSFLQEASEGAIPGARRDFRVGGDYLVDGVGGRHEVGLEIENVAV